MGMRREGVWLLLALSLAGRRLTIGARAGCLLGQLAARD